MRFFPAVLLAAILLASVGCNSDSPKTASASNGPSGDHLKKLGIEDVKVGTGPKVQPGDDAWVRYTGKLKNGTEFDSNAHGDDKPPFKVSVGQGAVIKGWDQGLVGMQKGGKRKLSIPYDLAYGAKPNGPKISAYSDLYFDIELVEMWPQKDDQLLTATDIKQGTGPEVKDGSTVTVTYTASVFGDVADSTKTPMTFKVGADQVAITGLDLALKGMKQGGERKVIVPPHFTIIVPNEKMRNNLVTFDVHLEKVQ